MGRLRVMTYNVKGMQLDRAALVTVIRAAEPEVLGLQEPPRGPLGSRRLRALAAATGLRVVVAGHGARTTALLVAPDRVVTDARAHRLPWYLGRTRRGYSAARVDGVLIVVLHLALAGPERLDHVDLILAALAHEPGPRVVVGDLNEEPGGPTWARLTRDLRDAGDESQRTFTARRPRGRLDAVLVGAEVRVNGSRVPDDEATRRASDHLPIVVDLFV